MKVGSLPVPVPPLTFLKKRASEPVRRGRLLPAWGSEVTPVVRPGEAVSRNCVLMAPDELQDRTGIRAMVRSLLRPTGAIRFNSIQNLFSIQMILDFKN